MGISKAISKSMKDSSWIRAMFEEGEKMKKIHGPGNILDFTLGNPVVEPPDHLKEELVRLVSSDTAGMHRYMTNSGYEDVRTEIAEYHRERTGLRFTKDHIVMTVGSAGGMNVVLKSLLDPGSEVIVLSPFFVEFKFYIENHGGIMKLVETTEDFHLDIDKIEKTITRRTKAIIVNSPNNPTGVVYGQEELMELSALLHKRREKGQRIFFLADEAYRKILYDGITLPDVFGIYEDTITVTSHSKDLALPGERIGYIAASPRIINLKPLMDAMIFSNRILGFINAPALMQRLVGKFQRNSVDVLEYQKKRDVLYNILVEAGLSVVKPMGAFYIFPRSPITDDVAFVRQLQKHRILAVPGVGFGTPGHFRLAYCIPMDVIERSRQYFLELGLKISR
ncbi:MAG: pyridoxal phosphate-dependent aminotransferase [Syntrophorhabdaceae bacterium]|nr:pyridoxal phosphate-dependent aminotransferase [Syntrophorhabdaceae bacterium]MDD4196180.1 pyridoxal phosphate-dependent aminotransferase [Syntrophorhabdaceae bacterium]